MASVCGAIDDGKEVIPPDYPHRNLQATPGGRRGSQEERLLVKKKADLGGDRVTHFACLLWPGRVDSYN